MPFKLKIALTSSSLFGYYRVPLPGLCCYQTPVALRHLLTISVLLPGFFTVLLYQLCFGSGTKSLT